MIDVTNVYIDQLWMSNAFGDWSRGGRGWRPWYKHGEDGSGDHDDIQDATDDQLVEQLRADIKIEATLDGVGKSFKGFSPHYQSYL
jgi:hypothetical protein